MKKLVTLLTDGMDSRTAWWGEKYIVKVRKKTETKRVSERWVFGKFEIIIKRKLETPIDITPPGWFPRDLR